MAFTDPQSVTISGTATSLPRTVDDKLSSDYAKDDGSVKLRIRHMEQGSRRRDSFTLRQDLVVPDLFVTGVSRSEYHQWNLTYDGPAKRTITVAQAKALGDALLAYATATSGAKVTQLLGGEH